MTPVPIAVLISGGGRTLLNLAERIESGALPARIVQVVASRECAGAERSRVRGLPTHVEPPVVNDPDGALLASRLRETGAEWIVLAGYLRLLHIPRGFEDRVVNIHPALLPAFGGPGMYGRRVHEAVLRAGCKVSGCTVHLCDDRYDNGPIVAQAACRVREGDTADSLGARVFRLEQRLYPEALRALLEGRVEIGPPDESGRRITRTIPA